jgi:hypothetical protein
MSGEDVEFKMEASRRCLVAGERLSVRNLPRKDLLEMQASMQTIMNSCAVSSEKQSKKSIMDVEYLSANLREAKEKMAAYLVSKSGASNDLSEIVNAHHNEADIFVEDLERKLNETLIRWKDIKRQSVCRAVVIWEEPAQLPPPSSEMMPLDPLHALDKGVGKIGVGASKAASKVGDIATSGVDKAAEFAGKGFGGAANLAMSGVSEVGKLGSKVSNVIGNAVGLDTSTTPSKPNKPVKTKNVLDKIGDQMGF